MTDITVPLGREVQRRWIYAFPRVVYWLQNELPNWQTGRLQSSVGPPDQMDDYLFRWIAGRDIRYEKMFKDLMPMADEVWEMKTADVRLFGWMCAPRRFIAVVPGYADDFKGIGSANRYEAAKRAVIRARDELPLDQPKIALGAFNALVSV
ncbi:hypothetical protein [Mesorhizobium sp. M0118]|uniref:hypothetical protein n=1 Tax=Mesorhizobium sp. M0118 TaxID=2956884 RepID=UPI00333D706C